MRGGRAAAGRGERVQGPRLEGCRGGGGREVVSWVCGSTYPYQPSADSFTGLLHLLLGTLGGRKCCPISQMWKPRHREALGAGRVLSLSVLTSGSRALTRPVARPLRDASPVLVCSRGAATGQPRGRAAASSQARWLRNVRLFPLKSVIPQFPPLSAQWSIRER